MSMVKIAGRDIQFPVQQLVKIELLMQEKKHSNSFYNEQKRKDNIRK